MSPADRRELRSGVLVLLGSTTWEGPFVAALAHPSSRVPVARRCLDTADLVATAAAGMGRAAIIGAEVTRLNGDTIRRLRTAGLAVVGVADIDDDAAALRLHRHGVRRIVRISRATVGEAVREVALALAEEVAPLLDVDESSIEGSKPGGMIVAVWGPTGAPGRTSVAIAVADEAARLGHDVLLIDADTHGACIPQLLGVVDEGSGLAAACRRGAAGMLDVETLNILSREVRPGLRILSGISRPDRWPELRESGLDALWPVARAAAALVIIDSGFCLEQDEGLVFDTDAPRRNAATVLALETADLVVAVGAADPIAITRLVAGLGMLHDTVPGARTQVVVTQVRESVSGRRPVAAVGQALHRWAGVSEVVCVPDDRASFDQACREGVTIAEAAPTSSARKMLRSLTISILEQLKNQSAGQRSSA